MSNRYLIVVNGKNSSAQFNTRIHHFREFSKNKVSGYGGYTSLFCLDTGKVFTSKCRDDEQFSRRKGILTCLQKMMEKAGMYISSARFSSNLLVVQAIADLHPPARYFWLNNQKIPMVNPNDE